jgi:hypothetical protein
MRSRTIVDQLSGALPHDVARPPVGLRNVSKMFGGQVALDDVSFNLASRFQPIDSAESRGAVDD